MKLLTILFVLAMLAGCGGGGAAAPADPPAVLIEGDSLASPPWSAWPAQLAAARPVVLTAAPGRTAAESRALLPAVLAKARPGDVLVLITGTNDLVHGRSAADTWADIRAMWGMAQGLRIVGATVASGAGPDGERQRLNSLLLAGGAPLLRLDLMFPDPADDRYYLPDRTHYTAEADKLIGAEVDRLIHKEEPRP